MLEDGKIYQDIWVKGRVAFSSGLYGEMGLRHTPGPECDMRYLTIKMMIQESGIASEKGKDGMFRVLDVGACYAYFGIRLCEDYPKVHVTAGEVKELDMLRCVLRLNNMHNRINVWDIPIEQMLVTWPDENKFDVVLLLNVLHHIPQWHFVLEECLKLCKGMLFIEHPTNYDTGSENHERVKDINVVLDTLDKRQIGMFPSHRTDKIDRPMYAVMGQYGKQ